MKPQRIQLSRKKGWRMPPNTVKVDRSTKWGNPFRINPVILRKFFIEGKKFNFRVSDADVVFVAICWTKTYEYYTAKREEKKLAISAVKHFETMLKAGALKISIEDVKSELKGKNLACWCKLGEPCHADILLKIANEE